MGSSQDAVAVLRLPLPAVSDAFRSQASERQVPDDVNRVYAGNGQHRALFYAKFEKHVRSLPRLVLLSMTDRKGRSLNVQLLCLEEQVRKAVPQRSYSNQSR
jgi:hypothetical protein